MSNGTSSGVRGGRWLILGGSATAGIGAFGFIIVATRSLGLVDFSPISQLWTVWAVSAAVVTFSGQVVTVRREVLQGRTTIPRSSELLPLALLVLVVIPVLFVFRERIFGDPGLVWPFVGTLIPAGSYATGLARGWLAVHGTPLQLATVIGGENMVRAALAVVMALVGAGPLWYAGALLAGYSVALVGVGARARRTDDDVTAPDGPTDRLIPFSAAMAGICGHVLLVVAPTVLAVSGGDARAVSALFAVMAVYRAPYQLVLGVVPALAKTLTEKLPHMTPVAIAGQARRLGLLALALAAAAAAIGWLAGEPIVAPLFDARSVLDAADHALAAGLTLVATGGLMGSVALLAIARSRRVIAVWGITASLAVGISLLVGADPTAILLVLFVGLTIAMGGVGLTFLRVRKTETVAG